MKIWPGYGSEHSTNLVMIGTFQTAADAETTNDVIEKLGELIEQEVAAGRIELGETKDDHYSQEVYRSLSSLNVYSITPRELEQFQYDVNVKRRGDRIIITTDENDMQAWVKLLIDRGARIEMYSAHNYPDLHPDVFT